MPLPQVEHAGSKCSIINSNILAFTIHHTPLGTVRITGSECGITGLRFEESGETEASDMPILEACKRELDEYFEGKRRQFDIKLDWSEASNFNQKVWTALLNIPFGKTMTYKQIATQIGAPKAARAVGRANGLNPIAIIVPCHRLIGIDGKLRGYAYGLERKQTLLDLERRMKITVK